MKHAWRHLRAWQLQRKGWMPLWREDKTAAMLGIAQYGCPRCGYGSIEERDEAREVAEEATPGPETCPSLCVERSHPGREHDPTEDGCYCWDLCAMGPTCPGANAGLDRGCWRTKATPTDHRPVTTSETRGPGL